MAKSMSTVEITSSGSRGYCMISDYDILRTDPDGRTSYFVAAAQDLKAVLDRIDRSFSRHPGEYLVFSHKLQRIVLIITAAGDILAGPRPLTQ